MHKSARHLRRHRPPRRAGQGEGELGLSALPRPSLFHFQAITRNRTDRKPLASLARGQPQSGAWILGCWGPVHPAAAPTCGSGACVSAASHGVSQSNSSPPAPVLGPAGTQASLFLGLPGVKPRRPDPPASARALLPGARLSDPLLPLRRPAGMEAGPP